jgi:hypothetical protein
MQIRSEALGVYYAENTFHLTLKIPPRQVLQKLQKFVDGKHNAIEMRVREVIFSIDQTSNRGGHYPYNSPFANMLGYLPFRFLPTDGEEKNSASRWTDRSSAREEFIARAQVLGYGPKFAQGKLRDIREGVYDYELTPSALELFDAVWMLADTFPGAKKWISTTTDLPLRFIYTAW